MSHATGVRTWGRRVQDKLCLHFQNEALRLMEDQSFTRPMRVLSDIGALPYLTIHMAVPLVWHRCLTIPLAWHRRLTIPMAYLWPATPVFQVASSKCRASCTGQVGLGLMMLYAVTDDTLVHSGWGLGGTCLFGYRAP